MILFPFNWLNFDGENETSKGEAVGGEVTTDVAEVVGMVAVLVLVLISGVAGGGKGLSWVSVLDSLPGSSI